MNSNDQLSDRQLDRLVDGELTGDESRRLLAALDEAPDAWRNCALAFIEAQAWHEELGGLRREMPARCPTPFPKERTRGVSAWSLLLAMAATFLIAFGIGNRLPFADRSERLNARPVGNGPEFEPHDDQPIPLGNVVLEVGEGSKVRRIEVPVYPMDHSHDVDHLFASPAVPRRVIRALEGMGHEVRRQQRLVPGSLQDGRRVVIPVEEFQIVPVGRRRYQ